MLGYVALGDSITFGQNASAISKAYPARVAAMLTAKGIPVKRLVIAQPNWTSADLLEEISVDPSFLHCANVATVWIGGNDLIRYAVSSPGLSAASIQRMIYQYGKRLGLILTLVRGMGVKHLICCTQYNPFPHTAIAVNAIRLLNHTIAASAAAHRCHVVRVDQSFSGHEAGLIDGYRNGRAEEALSGYAAVHPNDRGHEVIAAVLFSAIYPLLKTPRTSGS